MRKVSVVMFDMDGTLIDSMPSHAAAFAEVMNHQQGVPSKVASDIYIETSGKPVEVQFNIVLERQGLPKVEDTSKLEEEFWNRILEHTPAVYPDVPPALQELSEKGCKLFVISGSAPHAVEEKMRRSKLASYFSLLLGSDTKIPGMIKGPGHLGMVRQHLGLSEDEFRQSSAVVGDAPYDMQVAKQGGLIGVARVLPETKDLLLEAGADYAINILSELASVLGL